MTRISRLLSFLFFALVTAAQTPGPASPTPDELIVHARRTYAQEGPKAALPEFERALATFRESKDRRHEAITLGYIGNCYRRLGDFPRALDFVRRGMEIKRSLGDKLGACPRNVVHRVVSVVSVIGQEHKNGFVSGLVQSLWSKSSWVRAWAG
jgi:tetratricopeptide (TPR) repeat protein